MKTIWKFPLEVTDIQRVLVPHGAALLHAGLSVDAPLRINLWALVNSDAPLVPRAIRIYGTGQEIPSRKENRARDELVRYEYVGTVQMGLYVWHVFDEGEVPQ